MRAEENITFLKAQLHVDQCFYINHILMKKRKIKKQIHLASIQKSNCLFYLYMLMCEVVIITRWHLLSFFVPSLYFCRRFLSNMKKGSV